MMTNDKQLEDALCGLFAMSGIASQRLIAKSDALILYRKQMSAYQTRVAFEDMRKAVADLNEAFEQVDIAFRETPIGTSLTVERILAAAGAK